MFKALASRNFRIYYVSQGVSFTGNLIQEVALSWLVFRTTGEALYVGLLFFVKQIAAFFLSPLAGVLADQIPMRFILLATNTIMMITAFMMGLFTSADHDIVFWILLIQFVNGIIAGIDLPVRQAFVKDLISDRSQLVNAIALNTSLFNMARIGSPVLAGILVPLVGESICFLINAASFLTVIVGILIMRDLPQQQRPVQINVIKDIKEGMAYSYRNPSIKIPLIVTAGISLFGFPYTVLLTIFTKEILHGEIGDLGMLTTAVGIGSLLSGLYMANKKSAAGLQVLIFLACALYASGLILFSVSATLPLAMLGLMMVGMGQVLVFSSCNSIIQTYAIPQMTGRVLSLYIMVFMGCTTIGVLLVGALGDLLGPVVSLEICAAGCLITGLYLFTSVKSIKKRILVKYKTNKNFRILRLRAATP